MLSAIIFFENSPSKKDSRYNHSGEILQTNLLYVKTYMFKHLYFFYDLILLSIDRKRPLVIDRVSQVITLLLGEKDLHNGDVVLS